MATLQEVVDLVNSKTIDNPGKVSKADINQAILAGVYYKDGSLTSETINFTGTSGQTTFQDNSLKDTLSVDISIEGLTQSEVESAPDSNQFTRNTSTGTIVFGQAITGLAVSIKWFKQN